MAETHTEESKVKKSPEEESQTDESREEESREEPHGQEAPAKSGGNGLNLKVVLPLLALLAAVGIGVGVYFATPREDPDDGRIPYAQGVVLLKGDDLDPPDKGWINLTYNHMAFSSDGVNFSCFLTNDASNAYDLYFDIYADDTLKDQVFLSGLVPPGYGLREIELLHELPAGSTMCYVVFNQVDTDEDGNQSIAGQVVVTVEFVVS